MSKKHNDCCCCGGPDYDSMLYPYEYNPYATNAVAGCNNYSNGACGWNIWTIILAIIILQCSGVLRSNRAFILLLLFWFSGSGNGIFGGCGCGNNAMIAPAAPVSMPCCY